MKACFPRPQYCQTRYLLLVPCTIKTSKCHMMDPMLADPNTLAYEYVVPSLANYHFFDTPTYIEPSGFVEPSNKPFPCPSSSTEAGNQDSPYGSPETWSVTANSQGDELNNIFQGLP